ncbi:hypothetical protein Nepgr_020329 [Nepenthes gracilis]|uniref:Uncharacterized protein n=1 Tax=Nepenthes gracilis TaxID=150966 RepID=A0AAD3SVU7_NEPGR|nr:hypothetical protein Nepgr_020329 [Nepenthes gracilis]
MEHLYSARVCVEVKIGSSLPSIIILRSGPLVKTGLLPEAEVHVVYHGNLIRCSNCHSIGHRSAQCCLNPLPQPSDGKMPCSISDPVYSAPPSLPAPAPRVLDSNNLEQLDWSDVGESELLHEKDDLARSSLNSAVQVDDLERDSSIGCVASPVEVSSVSSSPNHLVVMNPVLKRGIGTSSAVSSRPPPTVPPGPSILENSTCEQLPLVVPESDSKQIDLSPLARRVAARINSLRRAVDKFALNDEALHGRASFLAANLSPRTLDPSLKLGSLTEGLHIVDEIVPIESNHGEPEFSTCPAKPSDSRKSSTHPYLAQEMADQVAAPQSKQARSLKQSTSQKQRNSTLKKPKGSKV